jgi:hypothetical protein
MHCPSSVCFLSLYVYYNGCNRDIICYYFVAQIAMNVNCKYNQGFGYLITFHIYELIQHSKHSTHNPNIEGFNPTIGNKMAKMTILMHRCLINALPLLLATIAPPKSTCCYQGNSGSL